MSNDKSSKPKTRESLDVLWWAWATRPEQEITAEELDYFREHPDQIDEVSSPLNLHKLFLAVGLVLGTLLAGLAKFLNFSGLLDIVHAGVKELIVDLMFEIGVALIGAAIVTFMMGITLNQQLASAERWRKEIRERLAEGSDP